MTPEQIANWKAKAIEMPRLGELRAWANDRTRSGEVVDVSPPNLVSVFSQWEQERIKNAKQVLSGAGVTRAEVVAADVTAIGTKLNTWINDQAVAQRPLFTLRAAVFLGLLFDRLADGVLDSDENATRDEGSKPSYGPSFSERNGFPNGITEEEIREVLKQ